MNLAIDPLRTECARLGVALAESEVALLNGQTVDLAPLGERLERLCQAIQGLAGEAAGRSLAPALDDLLTRLERLESRLADGPPGGEAG